MVVYAVGIVVVSVQVLRELVTYGMVVVQVESEVELSKKVSLHTMLRGLLMRLTKW